MIFVTVGTHEQQFNRLIKCVDNLKKNGVIQEEVIIQTGFSTYVPKYCKWSKFIPYKEMIKNVEAARIVVTHGGPATFIMPLQIGKTPIVIPRQLKFDEHVNDHQVEFCNAMKNKNLNIIVVENVEYLGEIIENYNQLRKGVRDTSNNKKFCENFGKIIDSIFEEIDER